MRREVQSGGRGAFVALLMDRGLLNSNELHLAEVHAAREGLDLPEALVGIGLISEEECYAALADATGLPLVDLDTMPWSELAVRLVPERLARRREVVPLGVDKCTLTYATHRPFDPEVERDVAFASGRRAMQVIARRAALLQALERCYPKLRDLDLLAARLTAERPRVEHVEQEPAILVSRVNAVFRRLNAAAAA